MGRHRSIFFFVTLKCKLKNNECGRNITSPGINNEAHPPYIVHIPCQLTTKIILVELLRTSSINIYYNNTWMIIYILKLHKRTRLFIFFAIKTHMYMQNFHIINSPRNSYRKKKLTYLGKQTKGNAENLKQSTWLQKLKTESDNQLKRDVQAWRPRKMRVKMPSWNLW